MADRFGSRREKIFVPAGVDLHVRREKVRVLEIGLAAGEGWRSGELGAAADAFWVRL